VERRTSGKFQVRGETKKKPLSSELHQLYSKERWTWENEKEIRGWDSRLDTVRIRECKREGMYFLQLSGEVPGGEEKASKR